MALPNLGVVGFPKCGSTTIFHEFRNAADIHTAVIDESTAFIGPAETENSLPMLEAKFYGSHKGERYIADIHPALAYSRSDISRMRRVCGAMKIICIMRDPLARAYSNYRHAQRWLAENRCLKEAFEDDLQNPISQFQFDGRTLKHYLSLSRYEVFVPHLWETFGRENVLCLQFENFFKGDLSERKRLTDFLEIDPARYPDAGKAHHNAGANWDYILRKNVTMTVDGKKITADRFVAIKDAVTDKIEWHIVNPSDATWMWFEKARSSAAMNGPTDLIPFYSQFDETIAFCEQEVFGRALPEWYQGTKAKAA